MRISTVVAASVYLGLLPAGFTTIGPLHADEDASSSSAALLEPQRVEAEGVPIDVLQGGASPCFGDFDGDGLPDLLLGQFDGGKLRIYRNVGSKEHPRFGGFEWFKAGKAGDDGQVIPNPGSGMTGSGVGFAPQLVDFDSDGLQDVLTCAGNGAVVIFRRQNDGSFAAGESLKRPDGLEVIGTPGALIHAVDWDNDGDLDLCLPVQRGGLSLLRNTGSDKKPTYGDPEAFQVDDDAIRVRFGGAAPVTADWDGDGLLDLVVGAGDGSVTWHRRLDAAGDVKLADGVVLVPPAFHDEEASFVAQVRVWDITSGKMLRQLLTDEPEAGSGAIALSKDGGTLVVGVERKIVVCDYRSGEIQRSIDVPDWYGDRGLAISPDGQFVCAPLGTTLGLWRTSTGDSALQTVESHTSHVEAANYSPDGTSIVTGADGTVRAWDAKTGRQKWSRALGNEPHVRAVAVSPQRGLIAAGGFGDYFREASVRMLRIDTGEQLQFIPTERQIRTVTFSPDGSIVAVVHERPKESNTYDLDLYDVDTGKHRITIGDGFFLGVYVMAFANDTKSIYTLNRESSVVGRESQLCIWDLATGKSRRQFNVFKPLEKPPAAGPSGKPQKPWIASAVFTPDLKTLITSQGRELIVWDVERGEALRAFDAQGTDKGGNIAVSYDGRLTAITDVQYAGDLGSDAIRVFDVDSGRLIVTFEPGQGRASSLAFSPDGTRLVTGMSDGTALVWDLATVREAGK